MKMFLPKCKGHFVGANKDSAIRFFLHRRNSIISLRSNSRISLPFGIARHSFHVSTNSLFTDPNKENDSELEEKAKSVTWIGLWSNLGLFALKGSIGYLSGSASLIADALHSGSDLCSDVVALAAIHISGLPPSVKHPYGYGHYETVGTLGVAFFLITAGIGTGNHALEHLIPILNTDLSDISANVAQIDMIPAAIACAIASVLIKEALYRVTVKIGRESRSPVLTANAWHHRTDSFSSVVALIGIGGYAMGFPYLDPVAGILVSGMIMKAGVQIGWDAIEDLTDRQRPESDDIVQSVEKIGEQLSRETRGEIVDVHNIRVRRLGRYVLVDLHVAVAPNLSVTAAYQAANRVKQNILEQVNEVNEVFTHVQAHPSRSSPVKAELSFVTSASHGHNQNKLVSIPSNVENVKTRPQFQIEKDIEKALIEANQNEIKGISHCLVHFNVSNINEKTGKRMLRQTVEVNLVMEKTITLAQAEAAARIAREYIMAIPDIHDVDIHVEVLPEGAKQYKRLRQD